MSRILDFIRDRWPWRDQTDPSFDPSIWQLQDGEETEIKILLWPPEGPQPEALPTKDRSQ